MIDATAPLIYGALIFVSVAAGALGAIVSFLWLAIGLWFVAKSISRGPWADAAFVVTWPIWLVLEPR